MKKIFLVVIATLMAVTSVNAQSDGPRHEVGVSYGVGASAIIDGLSNAFSNGLFDGIQGLKWKDSKEFGTLGIEYFYHLDNPRMALGGVVTFASYQEDVYEKDETTKVGDRKRCYYTLMPAIKYYWVNNKQFGVYTKAAAGIMFMTSKDTTLKSESSNDSQVEFMFQASLLGLEAGSKNVRAFAEFGVGEQGIILAGIRARF